MIHRRFEERKLGSTCATIAKLMIACCVKDKDNLYFAQITETFKKHIKRLPYVEIYWLSHIPLKNISYL